MNTYLNFKILEEREISPSGFCDEFYFGNAEKGDKNLLSIEFFNENEYWIGKFPIEMDISNKVKIFNSEIFILARDHFFIADLIKKDKIIEVVNEIVKEQGLFSDWKDFEIIPERNEIVLTDGERLFIFDLIKKRIIWKSDYITFYGIIFTKKEGSKIIGVLNTYQKDEFKYEFEFDFLTRKIISNFDFCDFEFGHLIKKTTRLKLLENLKRFFNKIKDNLRF